MIFVTKLICEVTLMLVTKHSYLWLSGWC